MSRSKHKHRQEKKRRHDRQIAEGTRVPREKIKKQTITAPRIVRRVKLSEIDPEVVRAVLYAVKSLRMFQ